MKPFMNFITYRPLKTIVILVLCFFVFEFILIADEMRIYIIRRVDLIGDKQRYQEWYYAHKWQVSEEQLKNYLENYVEMKIKQQMDTLKARH